MNPAMNYIFCPAYEPLYFVLHVWNNAEKKDSITVLTYHMRIKRLCDYLGIKVIHFTLSNLPCKNVFGRFFMLFRFKKNLDDIVKKLDIKKEDRFYLLAKLISYSGAYLAKVYSEKCTVYFKPIVNPIFLNLKEPAKGLNKEYLLMQYLRYSVQKVFGIKMVIYHMGIKYVLGIDEDFLKKCHIRKLNFDKSLLELRSTAMQKFGRVIEADYDTMVIDDCGWFTGAIISVKTAEEVYRNVFNMLTNYAVKRHPDFSLATNTDNRPRNHLPKDVQEFPDYIPSELLLKNVKRHVIASTSSVLISASRLTNLRAISIMELLEWKKDSEKRYYREYLRSQSNRIVFPRSFKELERLIKE